MPRQIRQLIVDLEKASFALVAGGKGSHRKFRHPLFSGSVILSGKTTRTPNIIKKSKFATPSVRSPDES